MRLDVDIESSPQGIDLPRRLWLDGRKIEVSETLDQWHGETYRYFKVRGEDGNLYIVRFDESLSEWELTMFQHPDADAFAATGHSRRPRQGDGP